ncbi:hypothetical protein [Chitinophaga filiformis]|uniref:ABC-2 family transporter protein n=1 Tax=Chitinophaga filiformis TaxID=104663 RepID=A0A1G7HG84_CHIFI|nr:hypothetical protein [Chitinophaga filiformis]SDE99492.1 hypothetical protein SAMN04488121_101459 [Chitinophaga filiformis]
MQTNNVFSAGRFGLYMRKHLIDNYRIYGMSVIVLTVLLIIILLFNLSDNFRVQPVISRLMPLYFMGLFLTGLIFTSLSFSELANKSQGIDYLLFPASQLEKYLSTLVVTTIGFLLIYHFAFYLAYLGIDGVLALRTGHHMENDLRREFSKDYVKYIYYGWFITQAVMLLGTIYFQKYSFIKTVFLFMIFLLSLYFLNTLFAYIFFGSRMVGWNGQFPFIGINVMLGEHPSEYAPQTHKFLMLPPNVRDGLLFFAKYLVTPMLWTLAYMRLRDKEM